MEQIKLVKKTISKKTLFLKDVFKTDCNRIEDIFQNRLMHRVDHEKKIYDTIPKIFTTLDKWPMTSNLLCWFCNRAFKTRPWFEPQSIEPYFNNTTAGKFLNSAEMKKAINTKNVIITCQGVFCSCNCVCAYINLHTHNLAEKYNKIAMLKYVYEIFTGISIAEIKPSPKHTEMIQYGGCLTPSEYQCKIDQLEYETNTPQHSYKFSEACSIYMKNFLN